MGVYVPNLVLTVFSMRYSSWSMRAWLALRHAGADFETRTMHLADVRAVTDAGAVYGSAEDLAHRRSLGTVVGSLPVLRVDGRPIHEVLAICEWANEAFPAAGLWPDDPLDRAEARALSSEMATGFPQLRTHLSCHPFARVPGFERTAETQAEVDRVFEIWRTCLDQHGGPFLFGRFGIVDCMYFPVITRFQTYDVPLPPRLQAYADAVMSTPVVVAWRELALRSPRVAVYDAYVEGLGGTTG